jgi:hypothetical protein
VIGLLRTVTKKKKKKKHGSVLELVIVVVMLYLTLCFCCVCFFRGCCIGRELSSIGCAAIFYVLNCTENNLGTFVLGGVRIDRVLT